jgi:UDP-glucose 4-epimerase
MEVKSVLITGGLGNLGSWLTHHYCSAGYEVTVLTKRLRNLEFNLPYQVIECDIASAKETKNKVNKPFDLVIHCASMNEGGGDQYPELALQINALGTRNLLEAIRENPPKHFIYFSTFHVYGKNSATLTETTEARPLNDYGLTHLFAEYYIKQYHTLHKLPFSIIRLSNSYGCPWDYDSSKWYLILNDLSRMAFERKEIVLKGNGKASRDFIWMGDVCKIIEKLALAEAENEIYNLSSEKSYSLFDIATAVQDAYSKKFGIHLPVQINENDPYQPGEPMVISSQKIKQRVMYSALPHFEEEALKIFSFLEKRNGKTV